MSQVERKALKAEIKALQRRQTAFAESAPAHPTSWSYARRGRANAHWRAGHDRDISARIAALYARLREPHDFTHTR